MPDHHTLRPAGRTRGVDDGRHIQGIDGRGGRTRCGGRGRTQEFELLLVKRDPGLQVVDQVVDFRRRAFRVDRRRDSSSPNGAQPDVHERGRIWRGDEHPVAGAESACAQGSGGSEDRVGKLPEGFRRLGGDNGRGVPKSVRGGAQQLRNGGEVTRQGPPQRRERPYSPPEPRNTRPSAAGFRAARRR